MSRGGRTALWLTALGLWLGPTGALPQTVPLVYRCAVGDSFTYETKVSVQGQVSRAVRGADKHASAISWALVERTRYDVKSVAADGTATLQARLVLLEVTSVIPGRHGVVLERGAEAVEFKRAAAKWSLPLPESGKPTPPEVITAIGYDPAALSAPVTLTVTPAGLVTLKEGLPWSTRLLKDELFHSLAGSFQPFGTCFLELPGRPLALGQEWQQPRNLSLPGAGEGSDTYRLDLLFSLDAKQPVGKIDAARIEYEGATTVQDTPLKVAQLGKAGLNLASLTSRLRGTALFDHANGRMLEHQLKSQLSSRAVRPGKDADNPVYELETELHLEADMQLLPSTK